MDKIIIAYNGNKIFTMITKRHYKLGDIINDNKIVYAIIDGDVAYIDTKTRDTYGAEWQTIAYHNSQYYDSVAAPTHIEYRKENGHQYRLYNGDTEDVYEMVANGNNLLHRVRNDLMCLLMGEGTKRQTETMGLQGYMNRAIRHGEVVYTEWIQRPIK